MFNQIPPSIYIAIGAFTAALIAGLFSYLNMIASKENKVSEFRQEWINELRNEISILTAASQSLSYDVIIHDRREITEEANRAKFLMKLNDRREKAIAAMTKITLMLNHKHLLEDGSLEQRLMAAIENTRGRVKIENLEQIINVSNEIRKSAGPLLKNNWEIVKKGEDGYNRIKKRVSNTIKILFGLIAISLFFLVTHSHSQSGQFEEQQKVMTFKYKSNPTGTELSVN